MNEQRKSPAEVVLEKILEAMIPAGGPFEEGGAAVALGEIEAFLADASSPGALRLCLRLLDLSPYFLPPLRLRRFSRLSLEDRVHLLEVWEASRLMPRRQMMRFLKLLLTMHFYSRPEIGARLGYPAPLERVPREEPAA